MNATFRFALASVFFLLPALGFAQEPASPKPSDRSVPLRLQVTITDSAGEKKISNLPYQLHIVANAKDPLKGAASLRLGVRVPVSFLSSKDGAAQIQYIDVGTDLDCSASPIEDGSYAVELRLERSSAYSSDSENRMIEWAPGQPAPSRQPILRQFRSSFHLTMRDGQTIEGLSAADPFSGEVLKISATLSVEK